MRDSAWCGHLRTVRGRNNRGVALDDWCAAASNLEAQCAVDTDHSRSVGRRGRAGRGPRRLALTLALLLTTLPLAAPRPVAAAACTVTNTTDADPGSLRAQLADTNCTTIDATGVTGTITLASNLPTLTRTVSVSGPGAGSLTIDRNDTVNGVAFFVAAGGNLTLSGLTVTKAGVGLLFNGVGSATVTNSTLSDNNIGLAFDGPGGLATVTTSTFSNNVAGLFFDQGGLATVTDSTLSTNAYGLYFDRGGSATVVTSTFSGNTDGLYFAGAGGSATVTNSTLSGNIYGLHFFGAGGSATVTNSTISGNTSAATSVGLYFVGGGSATLTNTLLARGTDDNCLFSSGGTLTNSGHNLADDATCFLNGANSSSVVAAGATGLDPARLAEQRWPDPDHRPAADQPRTPRRGRQRL